MPKLYDYIRSSAAYRVRIACNLKGIKYEGIPINLLDGDQKSEEYVRLNPSGLVPCFVDDDGTTLSQSLAILRYLDQKYPEPRIFPDDPGAAAAVWEMSLIVGCDIHPLNNLRVLKYIKSEFNADDPAVNAWYANWIQSGFTGLEELTKRTSGGYCYGDTITAADILLVPQMFNARRFKVPLDEFPNLIAIDNRLTDLAAFKEAAPQ